MFFNKKLPALGSDLRRVYDWNENVRRLTSDGHLQRAEIAPKGELTTPFVGIQTLYMASSWFTDP